MAIKTKLEVPKENGKLPIVGQPFCYLRKPITELVTDANMLNKLSSVNEFFRTLPNGDFHGGLADSRRAGLLEVGGRSVK